MANCKDCEKYDGCIFVECGDVEILAENKENNCEEFEHKADHLHDIIGYWEETNA